MEPKNTRLFPKWLPVRGLLLLIYSESERPKLPLAMMTLVSGVSNTLLLAIINNASHKSADKAVQIETSFFFLFLVTLLLFVFSKRYSLSQGTVMVEEVMRKLRIRIIKKIRHTELRFIETTGRGFIFNRLQQDTTLISSTAQLLFASMESAVMLIGALIYLVWLDFQGAVLTLFAIGLGGLYYWKKRRVIIDNFTEATQFENEFFDYFSQTIDGFKEVKINDQKSSALYQRQEKAARAVENRKVKAGVSAATVIIFSQAWFYILLGVIIFVLPSLGNTSIDNVIKLTTAILFIIGPVEMLVGSLPMYMKTNVAIDRLAELEQMIEKAAYAPASTIPHESPIESFGEIRFENVAFTYYETKDVGTSTDSPLEGKRRQRRLYDPMAGSQQTGAFQLGPVSFSISRGEIVFLIGGNGSGKTTLLKLLTGLYRPDSGVIYAFDRTVESNDYQQYRELYTTIFSDFFLFQELFGAKEIDIERLDYWLTTMELNKLTQLENNRWTNVNLSTGQRKRLAYINSLIDDKQIYIFDELAADQDPDFRKYFYRTLLPDLRANGKTIFAATHDDHYFDAADRIMKLDKDRGLIEISAL